MANELKNNSISETLITDLKQIILQARQEAYAAVNACMISTYWKIWQRIVEEEQQGKTRAEYGKGQLQELAKILTLEFAACKRYSIQIDFGDIEEHLMPIVVLLLVDFGGFAAFYNI